MFRKFISFIHITFFFFVFFIALQNVYTELTFFNAYTIHMQLTEFNSIHFNATLYVYGYVDQKKQPTDFHSILRPYSKIFDLKDTISEAIDNMYDDALGVYDSTSNNVKQNQLTTQAKSLKQKQENPIENRTYYPDYSASSAGGSEDYSLFENTANNCVINCYSFLLMMVISSFFY